MQPLPASRTRQLLALYAVPRWITHPLSRQQSVAEHSYRTAVLALAIQERLHELHRAEIPAPGHGPYSDYLATLRWALMHDAPEHLTGDIPGVAKHHVRIEASLFASMPWYEGEQNKAGRESREIVHIADLLEAMLWFDQYGSPKMRDNFTGELIFYQTRTRLEKAVRESEEFLPGLWDIVKDLIKEIEA